MKALGEHGLAVPLAIEQNRHAVLMSLVPGYPLVQVRAAPCTLFAFPASLHLGRHEAPATLMLLAGRLPPTGVHRCAPHAEAEEGGPVGCI